MMLQKQLQNDEAGFNADCKLLFVMLPVILIASVVAMVFVGLYMKAESPTTYFDGYYDSIQEVRENPKYIKKCNTGNGAEFCR